MNLLLILEFAAALGCGLVAGIFFAFSAFVMAALGRLPPAQGIAAMQSVNVAVINPVFMAAFLGTAALCLVAVVWSLLMWREPGAVYLLAGGVLYLAGTILVTMVFNVPLNDALASVEPSSAQGAGLWSRYLDVWTNWNHVRTVAALAAAASITVAIYLQARGASVA